jgi:hypothetical protein
VEPFRDDTGRDGAQRVNDELELLRESVFGFYGNMAMRAADPEAAAMLQAEPKPEALTLLETLLVSHAQPKAGGYLDQPWLLMQFIEVAGTAKAMCLYAEPQQTKETK